MTKLDAREYHWPACVPFGAGCFPMERVCRSSVNAGKRSPSFSLGDPLVAGCESDDFKGPTGQRAGTKHATREEAKGNSKCAQIKHPPNWLGSNED